MSFINFEIPLYFLLKSITLEAALPLISQYQDFVESVGDLRRFADTRANSQTELELRGYFPCGVPFFPRLEDGLLYEHILIIK